MKIERDLRAEMGAEQYDAALAALRADAELMAVPFIAGVLDDPETAPYPLVCEVLMHALDDDWHRERAVDFTNEPAIPAYFGADWGMFGFHMPGDVRAFENWRGPRHFVMGPPIYLDRPVYQYAYESLRWFDHWLKGIDNQVMDEPPVKLFIVGTDEWKTADDWPVPGTRWTPFYLHKDGILSEHEFWPDDGASTFEDAPDNHGGVEFTTPPMVENTEICGPIALNLYGSTTDTEALWFASLWLVEPDDSAAMLTRGWLRGSQRRLDPARSKPWQPVHAHEAREPLTPGEIYEFNIEIRPYGILLKAGQRLRLRVKSADDETPSNFNEVVSSGHLTRPTASTVTIHHDADHPSHLLLPITRGNLIGTFFSGGVLEAV
jgi:predicted acyl esterase